MVLGILPVSRLCRFDFTQVVICVPTVQTFKHVTAFFVSSIFDFHIMMFVCLISVYERPLR